MSWIENIQNKPHAYKVKLIWIVVIVVAVLMFIVWAFAARLSKNSPADTTLFRTIGRGLKDIKDNYGKR